jgi:hypothetical protein
MPRAIKKNCIIIWLSHWCCVQMHIILYVLNPVSAYYGQVNSRWFCLKHSPDQHYHFSNQIVPPLIVKKGKNVKLSLCLTKHHAMKTYWGSSGIAPRILDLGVRWGWVVSFTPRQIYPQEKKLRYPLDRRLCGSQSRSGRGGEEKISHPLPGIEPRFSR